MRQQRMGEWQGARTLASWILAVVLAVSSVATTSCAKGDGVAGGSATTGQVDASGDANGQDGDATVEDAVAEAGGEAGEVVLEEVPVEFDDECTDRRGDVSVYALCELTGSELVELLEEQDYVWSSRDQMWLKGSGSAALVACAPEASYLSREQMEELGRAVDEAGVSYRIVTSRYNNPRRAFDGVAGRVMVVEDVAYTDLGVVGVVQGTDPETRALVVATEGDGAMVVSVFGNEALAAGMLDERADRELGATIEDAFEALVGRSLEVAEE